MKSYVEKNGGFEITEEGKEDTFVTYHEIHMLFNYAHDRLQKALKHKKLTKVEVDNKMSENLWGVAYDIKYSTQYIDWVDWNENK